MNLLDRINSANSERTDFDRTESAIERVTAHQAQSTETAIATIEPKPEPAQILREQWYALNRNRPATMPNPKPDPHELPKPDPEIQVLQVDPVVPAISSTRTQTMDSIDSATYRPAGQIQTRRIQTTIPL